MIIIAFKKALVIFLDASDLSDILGRRDYWFESFRLTSQFETELTCSDIGQHTHPSRTVDMFSLVWVVDSQILH